MPDATDASDDAVTRRLPDSNKNRYTCPHCDTFAAQEPAWLERMSNIGRPEAWPGYTVHECMSCSQPIIWKVNDGEGAQMAYPQGVLGEPPNEDMPDDVRTVYEEARRVGNLSRRSAAALLRLALQMLVDRLEPGSGDINTKIGRMVQRGLNPRTQQAMDVLRVVGNNAVHPGQIDVDDDSALVPALFRLTNVIVDQMVSVPRHTQSLFDTLPERAREQISRRDGTFSENFGP